MGKTNWFCAIGATIGVVLLMLVATAPMGAAEVVHRYDFEEEDGADSVGSLDGEVFDFPDFDSDAPSGTKSIVLTGTEYVLVDPAEPMDFGTQFSVALWALPDIEAMNIQNLIGNGAGGYQVDGWKLFYNGWTADSSTADGSLNLETGDDVTGISTNAPAGLISEAEWTHIAALVDVDAAAAELYVNGELVASGNINGDMTTEGPFEIGRMMGGWYMHGMLDDVQIYDGLFTTDDVDWLYNHPGSVLGEAATALQAGDADMDLDFDQLDLVKVQIAAKYLTGQAATWGEGDWNGAPGGSQGSPPTGNGLFDQQDIIAALSADKYLKGTYAAITKGGSTGDGQTSVGYNQGTGEVWVDAPAGTQLTSINIESAGRIFTGDPAQNLGGSFDNDADNNIFKATFGSSFGSLTFGNVAQAGLTEDFVANDLTVVGSLAGGGALGNVDLIFVPEPATMVLLVLGLLSGIVAYRKAA